MTDDNDANTLETQDDDWGTPPEDMVRVPPSPEFAPAYISDGIFTAWSCGL